MDGVDTARCSNHLESSIVTAFYDMIGQARGV